MATIDSRVVSLKFDNSGFAGKIKQTMSDLSSLNGSIKGLSGTSLSNLADSAKRISFDHIADGAERAQSKINALSVAGGMMLGNLATNITSKLGNALKSFTLDPIIEGFQEYENQLNSVQTILGNTASKGETIQTVNAALDELNTYADKTIYNFGEMTSNIGMFTAAGVGLKDSVSSIKGLANLAALSGSTSQQASTAMYQLSQAISSGTIRLMDWNSVVNAGMGGEEFQKALKRTAMIHGKNVDEMIKTEGSFRDTLQNGWLTSEIMIQTLTAMTGDLNKEQLMAMGYTSEMADEMLVLATNASDSATKVKTFTQMMGTLKESVGSGWAQTWRLLMGDFEYARTLWTSVTNTIGGLIDASAAARNAKFQEFADIGGTDLVWDSFKNILYTVARVIQIVGDTWRKTHEEFSGVNKLVTLASAFNDLTKGMVAWIDNINNMEKMRNVLEIIITPLQILNWAFEGLLKMVGAVAMAIMPTIKPIMGIFLNLGATIGSIMWTIRKVTTEFDIFGAAAKVLYVAIRILLFPIQKLAEGIQWLTNKLFFLVNNNVDKIANGFHAFAEAVRRVRDSLSEKLVDLMWKLAESLKALGAGAIAGIAAAFGWLAQKIKALHDALAPVREAFGALRDTIGDRLGPIVGALASAFTALGAAIKNNVHTVLTSFAEKAKDLREELADKLSPAVDKLSTTVTDAKEGLSTGATAVGDFATKASDSSRWVKALTDWIGKLSDKISEFPSEGVAANISAGGAGALAFLSKLNQWLIKAKDAIVAFGKSVKESIGNAFSGLDFSGVTSKFESAKSGIASVKDILATPPPDGFLASLKGFGEALKGVYDRVAPSFVAAFKTIGETIKKFIDIVASVDMGNGFMGFLTGAGVAAGGGGIFLFVKKLTDSLKGVKDLKNSVVGFLDGLTGVLEGMQTKLKAEALKSIAIAIGLLVLSLFALQFLDVEKVGEGIVPLAVALAMAVVALRSLNDSEVSVKAVIGIIAIAAAMGLLAGAMAKMKDMSPEQMISAMIAMIVMMRMTQNLMNESAKFGSDGVKAGIGLVLMALAINNLAKAVEKLGELDTGTLFKGVVATSILIVIVGLFSELNGRGKGLDTGSMVSLMGMAGGLWVMAVAINKLGTLDLKTALQGMITMTIILAEAVVALNMIPKGAVKKSLSLVIIAGALMAFAGTVKLFAAIPAAEFYTAMLAISTALAVMVVSLNLLRDNAIVGAAAIMVIALALQMLTPVIVAFALLPVEGLFIAVAAITLLLAGIVGVGYLAMAVIPGLIVLAATILSIGVGVNLLGMGLMLAAIGLTMFAASGAAAGLALGAIIDVVIQKLPGLAVAAGQAVTDFILAIVSRTPELVQAAVNFFLSLLQGLQQIIPEVFNTLGVFFDQLWPFLLEQGPAMFQTAFDLLVNFLDGLSARMPEIVDKGVDCVVKFLDGVANRADDLVESAKNFITKFIAAIGNAIADSVSTIWEKAKDFASNFIDGVVNGLGSFGSKLVDGVKNLGQKMLDGFTDFFDIFSPSRLMRDTAKFIPLGVAVGVKEATPEAVKGIDYMGDEMLSSAQAMMKGLGSQLENDFGDMTITPVLDTSNVEAGASQIQSLMSGLNPTIGSARLAGATSGGANRMVPFDDAHYKSGGSVVFNQYNNSPKALSLWEIHRQTQNQLSAMEAARR